MIFNDRFEAKSWFLDYKELDEQTDESIVNFWYDYDFRDWRFGDYILFQHIEDGKKIGRPQYAIFTSFTVWDQSLVMQFVQNKRAWMRFAKVRTKIEEYNSSGKVSYNFSAQAFVQQYLSAYDDEVETVQFWTDNIHVLGHWKYKPTLSELKLALRNIITPLKELREGKIKDILK